MVDITTPDVWDLKADTATLEAVEQAWKAQAGMLNEAQDVVDRAANRVVNGQSWTGQTADAFEKHRRETRYRSRGVRPAGGEGRPGARGLRQSAAQQPAPA